ncbi:type I secretion system permease/ATPase [Gellertiella hungarica]|uniref:ATP-binding cassette subfamily C protein n=1 Tax=Gellertiella hungarica TaxID=1572859 RepID=A0A7W6NKP0_9HYPH|nr:type I secretion system permease/ATPase [Gellertiella hungarica]MBB4065645.1 ATP-binding cassette subfamily C protein [Gellertiella hungarica]
MSRHRQATHTQAIERAMVSIRRSALSVFIFSGIINLLYLTGSLFMLQVYDRVLSSRSVPTLVGLAVLTAVLYVFQGALDGLRQRIVARLGLRFDREILPLAFDALRLLTLFGRNPTDAQAPMRDLDTMRGFVSSQALISLFDLPWIPIYMIFVFALHPLLGYITIAGAVLLIALTLITEALSRKPSKSVMELVGRRQAMAEAARRNAESIQAMGFASAYYSQFDAVNERYMDAQRELTDTSSVLGSVGKVLRMVMQSATLGFAAYLTIQGELSAGSIIAANIISGRALAPIDMIIGQWKFFVAARQARTRLFEIIGKLPAKGEPLELPAPARTVQVENVTVATPGAERMIVNNISFSIEAGDGLAIIGPSGAGKSTLARAIVGAARTVRGAVRLDGAPLDQWDERALGQHIGYLPQSTELFDGTIAENISRFDPAASAEAVIEAAQAAGVHDLVLRLPEGYNTRIGEGGVVLSGGQRQRIGLARALYGRPFLVVLDEPASNLDGEGDNALMRAIAGVRERKGIVIMIAHRPSALAVVNLVAVIQDGALSHFGPTEKVMQQLNGQGGATPINRPAAVNS